MTEDPVLFWTAVGLHLVGVTPMALGSTTCAFQDSSSVKEVEKKTQHNKFCFGSVIKKDEAKSVATSALLDQ